MPTLINSKGISFDNLAISCFPCHFVFSYVWIHTMDNFDITVYFAPIQDFLVQYGHFVLASFIESYKHNVFNHGIILENWQIANT